MEEGAGMLLRVILACCILSFGKRKGEREAEFPR